MLQIHDLSHFYDIIISDNHLIVFGYWTTDQKLQGIRRCQHGPFAKQLNDESRELSLN